MNYVQLSKEVSYALRHAPAEYGLILDQEGFGAIETLLASINGRSDYGRPVTKSDLEYIVTMPGKRRHEIRGNSIRALYGHSVERIIERETALPPDKLYHGTSHRALASIKEQGLCPRDRQHVHLAVDKEIAYSAGKRKDSSPVMLVIDSAEASKAGISFYQASNDIWLAEHIPPEYIAVIE